MSLPLTQLRCAKIIQRFYNTYIKADRDKVSGLPIDPISQDIIPKERQLKLFITKGCVVQRIQYFDIYNLDHWFTARGQPVNPMTNVVFTRKQLADIRNLYNRLGMLIPPILEDNYLLPAEEDIVIDNEDNEDEEDAPVIQEVNNTLIENNILVEHLVYICSNPMAIDEIRDILYTNSLNIENDTFNINHIRNIDSPLISTCTALMNAVLNDNILAIEELLYFNPDLNISDSLYGYKAIDLAIIGTGENSIDILNLLLFHGARLDIPTNYGYSVELTNDVYKLEIIYNLLEQ